MIRPGRSSLAATMLALVAAAPAPAAPTPAAPAAMPFPAFERTTLADGVSHLTVFAMHRDRTGFLWFGTMYGLVRYDGTSFRTFRHDPFDSTSLPHDDVVAIAEDEGGDLWIGTWGGGAARYDRASGRFIRFLEGGADSVSISDGVVWAVAPRGDGTAFLGTGRGLDVVRADGTVLRRYHESERPTPFRSLPVRALCLDHEGSLWLGVFGGGLAKLDEAGDRFFLDVPDSGSTAWHPGRQVTSLLEDSAHRLWVGTYDRGLGVRLPGEDDVREVAPGEGWSGALVSTSIQALVEGPDGAIWVGSLGGLDRVDPRTREVRPFRPDLDDPGALPAGNVTCLARDASSGLWASAYQTGIVRMPARSPTFRTFLADAETPAARNVVAITETRDGTLWLATSAGLLAQPPGGAAPRTYPPRRGVAGGLPARARALAEDAGGTLWVGTFAGLRRWDAPRARFVPPFPRHPSAADDVPISVVLPSRGGALWVGADGFLLRLAADGETARFDPDPADPGALPDGTILSIAEDRRGRIWVGTYRGLARLDPGDTAFVRIAHDPRDPHTLASNYVYALAETADGTLWIGTAGGLDRWDEATGTFTHFREREGLPSAVVGSIEIDAAGRLWVGTQRGLARFDPVAGRAVAYSPADGLQGHLFHPRSSGRRADGTLLFGGPGGYSAVDPDALPPPPPAPPVLLADVRIPGRALPPAFDATRLDALRLAPHETFFTFHLAPLDFDRGPRVGVEYRLVGLDEDWVRAGGDRTAAYTSVPPGRYVFEARAAAADGPPGPVLSLPVTVLPPFWRTPAFLAALLTLVLAAAYGAHRTAIAVRVRHAEAVARARADEREAVRRAAAADFHDELGHRVARIGLFAELVARGGAPESEVPSLLGRIAREARRLADESRDFFWASGSEHGTAAEVLARLERFGGELFERSGVDFWVDGTNGSLDDVELPPEARRNMLSLFKEAMTNALRHAACREVVLRASVAEDRLTLLLEDDGRGFLAPVAHAGHGLRNMELRARRADGTLTIASEPGAGTRVALTRRVARRGSGNLVEPIPPDPRGDRRG